MRKQKLGLNLCSKFAVFARTVWRTFDCTHCNCSRTDNFCTNWFDLHTFDLENWRKESKEKSKELVNDQFYQCNVTIEIMKMCCHGQNPLATWSTCLYACLSLCLEPFSSNALRSEFVLTLLMQIEALFSISCHLFQCENETVSAPTTNQVETRKRSQVSMRIDAESQFFNYFFISSK